MRRPELRRERDALLHNARGSEQRRRRLALELPLRGSFAWTLPRAK